MFIVNYWYPGEEEARESEFDLWTCAAAFADMLGDDIDYVIIELD